MRIKSVAGAAAGVLLCFVLASPSMHPAQAQAASEVDATSRLVVQLRASPVAGANGEAGPAGRAYAQGFSAGQRDQARRLAETAGLSVRMAREVAPGLVALGLGQALAGEQLESMLAELRTNPAVEFVEVDHRRYVSAVPTDPLYASQWYQQGAEVSATDFEAAWDTTTGAADTVVAIIDTGVRFDHPDLAGRVLAGYDFVSGDSPTSFATANDGDGWDSDASDPGDWMSLADLNSPAFDDCPMTSDARSSWHGTRVAAMTSATTNNATGTAGSTWTGGVLPVRVLGKCGGYDSDIVAGMRWAAGLPVAGVPANPNPARILNLSLGGSGRCSSTYSSVISQLTAAGVLVVVAGGNDSGPVETPANCAGVLAVGGLRHVGTKVGYSSRGPEIGVSAPAGNCPSTPLLCEFSLITATNAGATVPTTSTYTDDSNNNSSIGTSFSAPIVTAIAALMNAVNDELAPAEFIARIKDSARPFPAAQSGLPTCPGADVVTGQCNCTTSTCGAGIADAPGAINEALRPMARIVAPGGSGAGEDVVLDGSGSAAARNRTVSSYAWSGVSGGPVFVGAVNGPTATVAVPRSGKVTVALQVTDDQGRSDVQEVTLGAAAGGGGGGGGAMHPLGLLVLALSATGLMRRRRAAAQR